MVKKITNYIKSADRRLVIICAVVLFTVIIAAAVASSAAVKSKKSAVLPPQAEPQIQQLLLSDVRSTDVEITKFYIYGTHLHLEGSVDTTKYPDFSAMSLVLRNSDKIEKEIVLDFKEKDGKATFKSSKKINTGINLEEIAPGDYCILFRIISGSSPCYTSAKADEKFPAVEYYTITRNGSNNRVNTGFTSYSNGTGSINCLAMSIKPCKLPDDVYDVVIDAGHGGNDPGAVYESYKESDLTLKYAKDLKKSLEALGLKVKMTRTGKEKADILTSENAYCDGGRVEKACLSGAKYCFCIHFNSIDSGAKSVAEGFQIYCAYGDDTSFARSIVENVKKTAGAVISKQEFARVENGVYIRTFSKGEIKTSNALAKKLGYKPYETKNTKTTYYYMIRETGGIATGAYVDGRSPEYNNDANESRQSVVGIETYLLELGYICNETDLKNILENRALYIEALTAAIAKELSLNNTV